MVLHHQFEVLRRIRGERDLGGELSLPGLEDQSLQGLQPFLPGSRHDRKEIARETAVGFDEDLLAVAEDDRRPVHRPSIGIGHPSSDGERSPQLLGRRQRAGQAFRAHELTVESVPGRIPPRVLRIIEVPKGGEAGFIPAEAGEHHLADLAPAASHGPHPHLVELAVRGSPHRRPCSRGCRDGVFG